MTAVRTASSKALIQSRVCSVLETLAWPHRVGKQTLSLGKGMLHAFHYPIPLSATWAERGEPLSFVGPQVRGWGGSRQALGLNHPGLPAMALLSSDEMRMKPTLTLERVCPSAHLGGDPDSMTRCMSQTQNLRLSQEKLLAQDNTLFKCHQPFHPVWHPAAFPSSCQAHGNK